MDWRAAAVAALMRQRTGDGGWAYRTGAAAQAEPTAWAGLALLGAGELARARGAATWLARLQQPDGGVPISPASPEPKWPTAVALLLWSALDMQEPRGRAIAWLLGASGTHAPLAPGDPIQQDGALVGWAWNAGTPSWTEPTALAVLALARAGMGEHPRAQEGRRLLLDRAVPSGGWNYGNKIVLGNALRPQLAPTGLALLALAPQGGPAVAPACAYLLAGLPRVRTPVSLGCGLLGLGAWGHRPAEQEAWLAEAAERHARDDPRSVDVAHLLLAATGLPGAGR
jgi:hypothetical protein